MVSERQAIGNAEKFLADFANDFNSLKEHVGSAQEKLSSLVEESKLSVAKPGKILVLEAFMVNLVRTVRDPKQKARGQNLLTEQVNFVRDNSLDISVADVQPVLWQECLKQISSPDVAT